MKTIKRILLLLPLTLVMAGCDNPGTSGQGSNTNIPVEINSLKSGLLYLNTSYNYTISYYTQAYGKCSMIYTPNSIGFTASLKASATSALIKDDKGVYSLNYDNGYVAGEYYLDDNGDNITDLWGSGLQPNLHGVATDYINSLDDNITTLKITNKTYKIEFVKSIGYSSTDYVNVDVLEAYYEDGNLNFYLEMATKKQPELYTLENPGTSVNEDVETFLSSGGKPLELSDDLRNMRRLMKNDNFLRYIYDINENDYTGYELFNEHYFYTETMSMGNGSGAISLNQKANEEHSYDLRGCYMFNVDGSLFNGFTGIHLYPNPIYDKPDVTELYHYPKYLKLFSNMQYVNEGTVGIDEGGAYIPSGNSYRVDNVNMIYDFISNFSIDQAYDPTTCVPYALTIDIDLAEQDNKSTVTFVYYFTYNNSLYTMPIPFTNFGKSNVPLFDQVYDQYND